MISWIAAIILGGITGAVGAIIAKTAAGVQGPALRGMIGLILWRPLSPEPASAKARGRSRPAAGSPASGRGLVPLVSSRAKISTVLSAKSPRGDEAVCPHRRPKRGRMR